MTIKIITMIIAIICLICNIYYFMKLHKIAKETKEMEEDMQTKHKKALKICNKNVDNKKEFEKIQELVENIEISSGSKGLCVHYKYDKEVNDVVVIKVLDDADKLKEINDYAKEIKERIGKLSNDR